MKQTLNKMSNVSTTGRRIGQEVARAAMRDPVLSRISETGESASSRQSSRISVPSPQTSLMTQAKDTCDAIMNSKLAVSLVVFLFTFILLCALNPPMAQNHSTDSKLPPTRSVKKIIVWSSLAAGVAILLPLGGLVKQH